MRTTSFVALSAIAAMLIFSSCKKNQDSGLTQYEAFLQQHNAGPVSATMNDAPWKIDYTLCTQDPSYDKLFNIQLVVLSNGLALQSVGVSDIPLATGVRKIVFSNQRTPSNNADSVETVAIFALKAGDAVTDFYEIRDSTADSNYISISNYDKAAGRVQGSFRLTLIRKPWEDQRPAEQGFPDTLRIAVDHFDFKLRKP